jgi:uncharacterized protein (TIGR02466 family)
MLIQNIFTNFLATDFIIIHNQEEIEKFCYNKIFIDSSDPNQSDISDLEFDTFLFDIKNQIEDRVYILLEKLGINKGNGIRFVKKWLNLNHNRNISTPHVHTDSLFSGVLYIKSSNSAKLTFLNPNAAHHYVVFPAFIDNYNEFTSSIWSIEPEAGKLIIFPSWLMHYVESDKNDNDRISLAFNINLSKNQN